MAGGSGDEECLGGYSEYHTPPSCGELHPNGRCDGFSTTDPTPSNLRTEYYSARIEGVRESMLKLGSGVEFQIQSSKDHWTSVDDVTEDEEYSVESDRQYFEKLKLDHCCQSKHFFKEHDDLVVGEKIGEGGQADIHVAGFRVDGHAIKYDYVVKVLKGDIPLKLLHSQWPPGLFSFSERLNSSANKERLLRFEFCGPFGGTLLKDKRPELNNRFAFVMLRYENGDLRTLIDKRMLHNSSTLGPPFSFRQMVPMMYDIAGDMMLMHAQNILHRDMKASNVFIYNSDRDLSLDREVVMRVQIADFESSVGVLGTGFWRAPEILLQLKNRIPSSNVEYTCAADVYSYGMLCYEIVTGRIPFEGHSVRDYDVVLRGKTLDLPSDLHPVIKNIIESCWHRDPLQRPTFSHIFFNLLIPLKSFF